MAKKPKTTVVPKIIGGGNKYDSINKGIENLNKSLAGGITGVKNNDGSTIKGKVYFTPQGATNASGTKKYTSAPKEIANTTGVTANPKNTDSVEPGVISSKQGEDIFNSYNAEITKAGEGLGTKDSPYTDAQISVLEKNGVREGDSVQGKGVLKPGGYFEQPVSTGVQNTTPDSSATYIDPTTGATTTTTGAGAGSTEEQAKMKEKGYSLSESTTPAEDTTNPEIKKLQEESAMLERDALSFKNKLMGAIITDSELKSDIRAITNAYDARIAEMQDINARQIQGVKTLGLRTGAQYTGGFGGVWGSIISEAERSGLMRITDIESERQSKIIAAKSAAQENNYKIYASLMEDARSLAKEKKTEVANLIQEQKKQDAIIAEHKKQIITDAVISEAYAQGYTTPEEIVGAMNAKGNYITLEEADKALKILNPPDRLKGLSPTMQDYEYFKKIDPDIAKMSPIEYMRMVENAKRAPKEPSKLSIDENKINSKSILSQFIQPFDANHERIKIPGTQKEDGTWDYFLGQYDGYIGEQGLRYLLDGSYSLGLNRTDILDMAGHLINPKDRNTEGLVGYGLQPNEIQYYTNVKAPQATSIDTTIGQNSTGYNNKQ